MALQRDIAIKRTIRRKELRQIVPLAVMSCAPESAL